MSPEAHSSELKLTKSQDRLSRILGTVRLKKVKEPPSAPVDACCPQCGSTDAWGTAPWCLVCHYSPQLGREVTESEISNDLTHPKPERAFLAPQHGWVPRLVASVLVIVAIGLLCRFIWPQESDRVIYGRILLATGVVILGIAHAWAYLVVCRLLRHGPITNLTAMSLFHPIRIWRKVVHFLPATCNVLSFGAIGVATMVMSCTMVGLDIDGIRYNVAQSWLNQRSGLLSQIAPAALEPNPEAKTATAVIPPAEITFDDETAGQPTFPRTEDGLARNMIGDFHIFGYLTNANGEMRSVLVAHIEDQRGRFVGRVPIDGLDKTVKENLQLILDQNRTSRPPLPMSYRARWVKPVVVCQIAFVEWTNSKTLKDGHLINYSTVSTPAKLAERPHGESLSGDSKVKVE